MSKASKSQYHDRGGIDGLERCSWGDRLAVILSSRVQFGEGDTVIAVNSVCSRSHCVTGSVVESYVDGNNRSAITEVRFGSPISGIRLMFNTDLRLVLENQ